MRHWYRTVSKRTAVSIIQTIKQHTINKAINSNGTPMIFTFAAYQRLLLLKDGLPMYHTFNGGRASYAQ